jgi:hypothetical protein
MERYIGRRQRSMPWQKASIPAMPARHVTLKELIEFLKLSIRCAVRACDGLRYDFYTPTDRYAVLLLYATLDHGRSVIALAEAGTYTAIPIVTRTALDAYADIANLCDHPRYWENLKAADASKWKPLLERASQGDNPVLKAFSEDELLPIGRRHNSQELKELRARGVESLGIETRFERAGLTNEYESMYAILSAEAHNNVSNLQSRYIDWNDERAWITKQGEVSAHQHHYERPCTLTMSEIVIRSAEKVLRLCGHGAAVLCEANTELERISAIALAEDAQEPSNQ